MFCKKFSHYSIPEERTAIKDKKFVTSHRKSLWPLYGKIRTLFWSNRDVLLKS